MAAGKKVPGQVQQNADNAHELSLEDRILASRLSKDTVDAILKTDDRVIARVTDGIYRQPGSALRELISNAYDADAKNVYIETDAPRFGTIKITDDGRGMSPKVLARLLEHIGGSSKRTHEGSEIGVASASDSTKSKSGRKLIGKIGIGLFSVAQLTQKFQIITKIEGESYRTIASVVMRTYTEDDLKNAAEGTKFESGRVKIWSETADDKSAHGTTVILSDLRPQARDTLRSRDVWTTIHESTDGSEELSMLSPPLYHIGHVDPQTGELITDTANVPWDADDSPSKKFSRLVDCVWDQVGVSNPNPKLADLFDYYLQMVWNLSLSAPLPYVEQHPFEIERGESIVPFMLMNMAKGSAKLIELSGQKKVRSVVGLEEGANTNDEFNVYLDSLKLARPIRFNDLPRTSHTLQNSLMFFGKCNQEFSGIPKEISSGSLKFEAYLFWTPKIAPREHRGALVRVNGASGTLFDTSFMRYQTSENMRLSQITCEIFVHAGLDGALNIDRESFNFAHPHYVYLTRWLHSALRQVANTQKKLASDSRAELREIKTGDTLGRLQEVVRQEWSLVGNDPDESPPPILFHSKESPPQQATKLQGAYAFDREVVLAPLRPKRKTATAEADARIFEERIKAIAQLLAAYGVFDQMTKARQERLLRGITDILATEADQ